MNIRQLFVVTAVVSILCLPAPAGADDSRFAISLGAFLTDHDSKIRLDSQLLGLGTVIDLESDLGLDPDVNVARIDGFYRFNRRHGISFSYFDLSERTTSVIDKQIQFGDEIFDISTTIIGDFDLGIAKLAYTWTRKESDTSSFSLSAGLHIADISLALSEPLLGRASIGKVTAPLPVFGVRGSRKLGERWTARYSGEFFALEFDNINGSLVDLYAGVDFHLTRRLAAGLAYNFMNLDVRSGDDSLRGKVDWEYGGWLAFLQLGFGQVE